MSSSNTRQLSNIQNKLKSYLKEKEMINGELQKPGHHFSGDQKELDNKKDNSHIERLKEFASFLFNNAQYSDVVVSLKGQKIPGHRVILAAQSDVWKDLGQLKVLDLTEFIFPVAYAMLRWIYTNEIGINADFHFMVELLQMSSRFKLVSLQERCRDDLKTMTNAKTVESISYFAEKMGDDILEDYCKEFVNNTMKNSAKCVQVSGKNSYEQNQNISNRFFEVQNINKTAVNASTNQTRIVKDIQADSVARNKVTGYLHTDNFTNIHLKSGVQFQPVALYSLRDILAAPSEEPPSNSSSVASGTSSGTNLVGDSKYSDVESVKGKNPKENNDTAKLTISNIAMDHDYHYGGKAAKVNRTAITEVDVTSWIVEEQKPLHINTTHNTEPVIIMPQKFSNVDTFAVHSQAIRDIIRKKKAQKVYQERRKMKRRQRVLENNLKKGITNPPTPFKCSYCDQSFQFDKLRKDHENIHYEHRPHVCEYCKKSFTEHISLVRHLRIHIVEKKYACHLCKRKFAIANSLKKHIKFHEGEQNKMCSICGKIFYSVSSLTKHMLVHSEEKTFICDKCGKSYKSDSGLKKHLLSHEGTLPFSCEVCDKSFAHRKGLDIHRQGHSGAKPFICDVCGSTFRYRTNLMEHSKIHSRDRPFRCVVCSKGFKLQLHLQRHYKYACGKSKVRREKYKAMMERSINVDTSNQSVTENGTEVDVLLSDGSEMESIRIVVDTEPIPEDTVIHVLNDEYLGRELFT